MAGDLVETLSRASGEKALLAEFQLYMLTDPELRKGMAAAYVDAFAKTADHLSRLKGGRPR